MGRGELGSYLRMKLEMSISIVYLSERAGLERFIGMVGYLALGLASRLAERSTSCISFCIPPLLFLFYFLFCLAGHIDTGMEWNGMVGMGTTHITSTTGHISCQVMHRFRRSLGTGN